MVADRKRPDLHHLARPRREERPSEQQCHPDQHRRRDQKHPQRRERQQKP